MKIVKDNILILILVSLLAFTVYHYFKSKRENSRLHSDLIGKTQKIEFLSDKVANLERKYLSQKKLHEKVTAEFSEYRITQEKRLKLLSNATFLIREKARQTGKSDIVYQGTKLKYIVNEIKFNNGPAIGYILIFDDGRVVSKIYNHEINVKTLVARDEETGNYDVASKADYVLKSPAITNGWLNKPYPIKIKGGTALIDPTEPIRVDRNFYFWTPQLNANINISTKNSSPGLGISLMGYGYSKRDLDYKFIQLGGQYNNLTGKVQLTFVPLLWRPLPNYFNNTYMGSGVSVDEMSYNYFFGIQTGF